MSGRNEQEQQDVFQRLKKYCVPLLESSLLTPASVSHVSRLLTELIDTLKEIQSSGFVLTASMISYVFYPLSTILRRNPTSQIFDQVLEKLLIVLAILCETWWWDCDTRTWEQVFMFSGAILTGLMDKDKGKVRADETKLAAVRCLLALLRERTADEDPLHLQGNPDRTQTRLALFQAHARTTQFIPILGQSLDSLLATSASQDKALQGVSLQLLDTVVRLYLPDGLIPSVLPGVVSSMNRVALGLSGSKGWANGNAVAGALKVMQEVILRAIGDDVCIKEGAVQDINELEDLMELVDEPSDNKTTARAQTEPYVTPRTPTWLRGTSSQLHIAINSLTPLASHPNPSALRALCTFSATIVTATSSTLPQTQPLLLSFLLSLTNSPFKDVSDDAQRSLVVLLLSSSKARYPPLHTIIQMTKEHLASIPRLLPTHSDAKVEHIANLVEAVCRLTTSPFGRNKETSDFASISSGIGKLLGPTGGIEKWGWALLSVLEFEPPSIIMTGDSGTKVLLGGNSELSGWAAFPRLNMRNISSWSTLIALERMFRSLGRAAGDDCLYAVEWFISVGMNSKTSRAVAALWCAARLLEGASGMELESPDNGIAVLKGGSKRLTKLARALARSVSELWDESDEDSVKLDQPSDAHEGLQGENLLIEYRKGLIPIRLDNRRAGPERQAREVLQPQLHRSLCLHLIALTAGILQARFTPLFLHTLYPVLHSIISGDSYLSETATAALNFITYSTSFASPANLIVSNFDYALDSISRRFTRRWLDVDATKVLVVLVRLAGRDVINKAGDVVEECFDRLDEFHGYDIVVEGLVEVLEEVIHVIAADEDSGLTDKEIKISTALPRDEERLDAFFTWYGHRREEVLEEEDTTDYGPAPREAWGQKDQVTDEGTDEKGKVSEEPDPNAESPATPTQALTKMIVSRSLYFLTHGLPIIRAHILKLLGSAVPVLSESALLPSIHHAWPFILNRLSDPNPFVVSAAANLIEALASHVGSFMSRRIWNDVWPRFRTMLNRLEAADAKSALARRGPSAVGTESAYTHSHRLYRSLLRTMTSSMKEVHIEDGPAWEVMMTFRRFLAKGAHEELQACARNLYNVIGKNNEDAVWLVLSATTSSVDDSVAFMGEPNWQIEENVRIILAEFMQHV